MFMFHHAAWQPQRGDGRPTQTNDAAAATQLRDAEIATRPTGSSQELTARFARSLTLKEARTEQLVLARTTAIRSKSCASSRKLARRRLAETRRRQDAQLRASIQALQQNIANLERSRTLEDSHLLLWRTNRTGVVVDMCREYFSQFAQGYDSTAPHMALQREATRNFMYTVADEDLVCREYRGVDKLLAQWEIYTRFHSDTICRLRNIALIDEEDDVVSIRCLAELDLGISEATLRNLYPAFYAHAQQNDKSKQIADGLVGKRYVMSFDKVLHFNRRGKLFAHESKVHLASSLMEVLEDPFAALEVLQASVMTEDGHWKMPDVDYMRVEQAEMYEMPKIML